jgi:hypothetical protein
MGLSLNELYLEFLTLSSLVLVDLVKFKVPTFDSHQWLMHFHLRNVSYSKANHSLIIIRMQCNPLHPLMSCYEQCFGWFGPIFVKFFLFFF